MLKETRAWHWVDNVFFGIRALYFIVSMFIMLTAPELKEAPSLLLTLLFLLSALGPLLFWRPNFIHPLFYLIAEFVFSGSLSIYLVVLTDEPQGYMMVPTLTIGYLLTRKTWWWSAPAVLFAFPIVEAIMTDESFSKLTLQFVNAAMIFGMGVSFNFIVNSSLKMKQLLKQNEDQYSLIQEQNKALIQYSEQVEQLTLLEERNRMARELHDTVGHTFTSVIMGMDAVLYLIDSTPEKAKEKLEVLRGVTSNGLEEVRKNIHQIASDDNSPLSLKLSHLSKEFALHTATKVNFTINGEETDISKHASLTLIRCLQESLTNAKRHGHATMVNIHFSYESDGLTLIIEDDGIGSDNLNLGFGLSAMQERLRAINGELMITSKAGEGTTITCKIPIRRHDHESNQTAVG